MSLPFQSSYGEHVLRPEGTVGGLQTTITYRWRIGPRAVQPHHVSPDFHAANLVIRFTYGEYQVRHYGILEDEPPPSGPITPGP